RVARTMKRMKRMRTSKASDVRARDRAPGEALVGRSDAEDGEAGGRWPGCDARARLGARDVGHHDDRDGANEDRDDRWRRDGLGLLERCLAVIAMPLAE